MEYKICEAYEKMNPTEEQKDRMLAALLKAQATIAQGKEDKTTKPK